MSDEGELLERYRGYLRVLAGLHLNALLRGKLDPSDVVQQTLLRAVQGLDQLRCREPTVVTAWLRQILARTMADLARDFFRGKRDIALERSIEAAIDRSSSSWPNCSPMTSRRRRSCSRKRSANSASPTLSCGCLKRCGRQSS